MNVPAETVKTSISRLSHDGLLEVVEWHHSCKAGGAIYAVTKLAERLIIKTQSASSRVALQTFPESGDSGSEAPVVVVGSLKSLKTTTTTSCDLELEKMLNQLTTRLNLCERFKIGPRDLADAFRKCGLPLEKFAMSVEHAAFHAGSENGKTLRSPGRWIVKRVSQGYELEPPDFESWAERQERLMVEDAQRQLDRLRALHVQRFEIEFEHYLLGLSTSDKQRVLRASEDSRIFADSPNSALATQQLRRLFAEKTARLHLLDGTNAGAVADD